MIGKKIVLGKGWSYGAEILIMKNMEIQLAGLVILGQNRKGSLTDQGKRLATENISI